jgi:hypothetical protein
VDEFYWEDRPRYYAALEAVQRHGEDLTAWLEYCAEALQQTLERVWQRIQQLSASRSRARVVLRPKQEQAAAARTGEPKSPRDLGRSRHFQAGRDGPDPPAGEGEAHQARRHTEERALRPAMTAHPAEDGRESHRTRPTKALISPL